MTGDQNIKSEQKLGFSVTKLKLAVFACLTLIYSAFSVQASAQVTTYTNTTITANNIDGTRTCSGPSAPLVRTFSVGTSYTVSDVDIGIIATHSWRGDMQMTLESPSGTRVQIVNGDTSGTGNADNFNVRLDDSAATFVNVTNTDHSTTASPYQNILRPNNALSAFNGQNSLGTWRLEICDLFPGSDNGTFLRADLFLSQIPSNYADLSLTKTVSNASPANGTAVQYIVSLNNSSASPNTATGVVVRDLLPAGVTYVSHIVSSGGGTYTVGTGDWAIPSIAPNQTRTLTINATVNATSGATVTNIAEVIASSQPDIDSTVNNGANGEDDYAARSFTVTGTRTAGTAPNLGTICSPANQILFDWTGKAWTSGSTNNSYALTGLGSINFALTSDVAFVTGSPEINATNTGGLAGGDVSLFENLNNNTIFDKATTTLTLPTAVPGLQFTVFDIDFGNNSFADKLTVTGIYNGTTVNPTLTNGISNYVTGNVAIGDAASANTSTDGNVVVTFLSPVDTVIIQYGNHTTAPADPGNQFMNIHDINFCRPLTTLSVTKISQVISDPFNGTTNPKAIPGATMQYCILMSNSGSASATSVTATDNIPATVTYIPASIRSGANCGSAATVEDDNATGADESDPFGASISGTTLTAVAATLGPAQAFALTFQVTVN